MDHFKNQKSAILFLPLLDYKKYLSPFFCIFGGFQSEFICTFLVQNCPQYTKELEEPRVGSYGPFKRKAGTSVFGHSQTNLNPTFRFQRQYRKGCFVV